MHGTLDILVTGGRMISRLDAVRSVTNESTGSTAAAIVEAFLESGAKVTYFHFRDAERPYRRHLQVNPEQLFDEQLRSLRKTHETYCAVKPQLTECCYETFDEYQQGLRAFATQRKYAAIVLAAAVADLDEFLDGLKFDNSPHLDRVDTDFLPNFNVKAN